MSNAPIDKGRATVIAEKYNGGKTDQNGQAVMSNRYATIGRATKWPATQERGENVELEIDTMPIGQTGPIKVFIFWDSENQNKDQQQNNGYQQQPQQSQQQQNQMAQSYNQNQGYGSQRG